MHMADQARLDTLVTQLNDALGDITPYKLAVVTPADLLPIDKNAHYMPKKVYDQVVSNIAKDGNLSSLPFCWRRDDGAYIVLSGNHRVQAARSANLSAILILYTDAALSLQEQRAIQLAHNALVGQDNPQILRELYAEIKDLSFKVYSVIDDTLLGTLAPVAFTRINDAQLRLEEITLLFLPAERERVDDLLQRVGESTKPRYAARLEDFDCFFEGFLQYKEAAGIVNSSTAFLAICEVMEAWLAAQTEAVTQDAKREF